MRGLLRWGGVAIAIAGLALALLTYFVAPIGTSFVAKTLCSGIFVSGRDRNEVHRQDVLADNNPLLPFISYAIDDALRTVEARFLGLRLRAAQFREGAGCAVTYGLPVAPTAAPRARRSAKGRTGGLCRAQSRGL